jgi:hypothetical protein
VDRGALRGSGAQNRAANANYELREYRRARYGEGGVGIAEGGVRRYATGGFVPGSGNTDSVHALLTPGEFVMSRDMVRHFAEGGPVGDLAAVFSNLTAQGARSFGSTGGSGASSLVAAMASFGQSATAMREALNSFAGHATALADALSKIPSHLTGSFTHNVIVTVNGAEALSRMMPEIKDLVVETAKEELGRAFKERLPEVGGLVG